VFPSALAYFSCLLLASCLGFSCRCAPRRSTRSVLDAVYCSVSRLAFSIQSLPVSGFGHALCFSIIADRFSL
jgi:hypothetical protein